MIMRRQLTLPLFFLFPLLFVVVNDGYGQCSLYPAGLTGLVVSGISDTGVSFHWTDEGSPQYFEWTVTNDSSYTGYTGNPNFVYYLNYTTDTVMTVGSLQSGTRYWIFVQRSECSGLDSVSFTTPNMVQLGNSSPCQPGAAPPPTPLIRSSTGYWAICGDNALLLTSSSPTGNTWLLDGQVLDSGTVSIGVTQPGFYSVVVTNAAGCTDTSAVEQVTADAGPPTPVVSTSSGSTMICKGSGLTLSSSAATGNQWYLGQTALSGQTTSTYLATSAGNYWVEVTDQNGCWSVSPQTVITIDSIGVDSTVVPAVTPAGPLIFCADTTYLLRSSYGENYQWYLNGWAITDANGDSLRVSMPGAYSVATTSGGCGSGGGMSSVVQMTYIGQVIPIITLVNGSLWSNYPEGNQWYLNDSVIEGATHQRYTPMTTGSYTVRLGVDVRTIDTTTFQVGEGGCWSPFSAPYVIVDSILTVPQVAIFPNPVGDVLTLSSKQAGPLTVRVFNLMGQEVWEVVGFQRTTQVDVSRWSKGVYFVQVVDQETQQVGKQVVVRL
jgi:Secretion system C-terminal sorting domain